jgi:hypothetical protein
MPIPEYLQTYAVDPQTKKNHTTFDLRCTCGHELFHASRRADTKEEKRLLKPYYDYLEFIYKCPRKYTIDENKIVHYWHSENGVWVEDNHPERPFFAGIEVFRVTCAACGREITVFDSRYHGYDAIYCGDLPPEAKAYQPSFRPTGSRDGSPMRIALKLEHDESLEEFRENVGAEATFEEYADAFTWIWIYGMGENGKKKKLFESETA